MTARQKTLKTPERASVRVKLDGQFYLLKTPKKYRLMQMGKMSKSLEDAQESKDVDAAVEIFEEMLAMVSKIFLDTDATKTRPSSRARFLARLEDDDDDLDLDAAGLLIEAAATAGDQARPTS